jgi:hypothetical protein
MQNEYVSYKLYLKAVKKKQEGRLWVERQSERLKPCCEGKDQQAGNG